MEPVQKQQTQHLVGGGGTKNVKKALPVYKRGGSGRSRSGSQNSSKKARSNSSKSSQRKVQRRRNTTNPKSCLKKTVAFSQPVKATESANAKTSVEPMNENPFKIPSTTDQPVSKHNTQSQSQKTSQSVHRKQAKSIEVVYSKLGVQSPVPVVNQSFFDSNYCSLVPFYNSHAQKFEDPFPLSSMGNFQASSDFSFIEYSIKNARKSYHDNLEYLRSAFQRQWRKIFNQDLLADYRGQIGQNQDEYKFFLKRLQLVGTMLEYSQMACAKDTKWGTDQKVYYNQKTQKPSTIESQVIHVPIKNSLRRNVLEAEGQFLFQDREVEGLMQTLVDSNSKNNSGRTGYSFVLFPLYNAANQKNAQIRAHQTNSIKDLATNSEDQFQDKMKQLSASKPVQSGSAASQGNFDVASQTVANSVTSKNIAFNREKAACSFYCKNRLSEPATSFNCYFEFETIWDYTVKHVNSAQLIGQQLLNNPIDVLSNPASVYSSVLDPVSGNPKNFIGNSVFYVGTYDKSIVKNPKPKVSQITGTVYPRLIAVLERSQISSMIDQYKQSFPQNSRHATIKQDGLTELIHQLYLNFCHTAKGQYADKAQYQLRCNPVIALHVFGDAKDYWLTTNFKIVDGQFLVRKPKKKDVFKMEYINRARSTKDRPTIFDVASLMPNTGDWKSTQDYINLHKIQTKDPAKQKNTNDLMESPTYFFLLLFQQVCEENGIKFTKAAKLIIQEISIFILVKDMNPGLLNLMHDYALSEISGSDFGQHAGIGTSQQNDEYKEVYKKSLMGQKVVLQDNFLKHIKRFTNASQKNILFWVCESSKLVQKSPEQLLNYCQTLSPQRSQEVVKFSHNLISKIQNASSSTQISNLALITSLETLCDGLSNEHGMISLTVGTYFYQTMTAAEFKEKSDLLITMMELFQNLEIIPFYIVSKEDSKDEKNYGMIPSAHMISLDCSTFQIYIARQVQGFKLQTIKFRDGTIGKKSIELTIKHFYKTLLRLLRFYLQTQSMQTLDQLKSILLHRNTLHNFANLIGSGIEDGDEKNLTERTKFVEDILQDQEHIVESLDTSIQEYGNIVRTELIQFLMSLEEPPRNWPLDIKQFASKLGYNVQSNKKITELVKNSQKQSQQSQLVEMLIRKRDIKAGYKNSQALELIARGFKLVDEDNDIATLNRKRLHAQQGVSLGEIQEANKRQSSRNSANRRSSSVKTQKSRKTAQSTKKSRVRSVAKSRQSKK